MVDKIEQILAELSTKIDALSAKVQTSVRFAWEEKTTDTGIQLAGGPTTVTKTGKLLAVSPVPTPQGIAFAFVLQDEVSKKIAILSPDLLKTVD